MRKRVLSILCTLALILSVFPFALTHPAAAVELPFSFSFTDAELATLEAAGGSVLPNENAEGGVVKGEVDHDGDGAAFKASHIPDTDYKSIPNGVRLTFDAPLAAETNYRISAWFYIPSEGNKDVEGKRDLIGPGILVNSNAGSDEYKWPNSEATAGKVKYDEWMNVIFETPAYGDEIELLDFRFYTNDKATHPEVYYLDDITVETFETGEDNSIQEELPGLKDIYADYFMFGTAVGPTDLSGKRLELISKHFNTVTFGNDMKPDYLQKEEGTFTFDTLDKMIATLKANNFNIIGHTLAWHAQSPDWMWSDKEKAQARLEAHIEEVLTHVGADIVAVDVVNEAFTNSTGNGNWRTEMRSEGWYSALGSDFIEIAFRKAGEVRDAIGRPDLKLYYNDFNLDEKGKSTCVYEMVKELQDKGVPIDGIGMQSHYNQNTSVDNVRNSIELFASIPGIEVSITELDITIQSSLGQDGLNEEQDKQQAALYSGLFKLYKEYAAGSANENADKRLITRVTIWGVTDKQSWRGDRHPILFDKNNKAKGAFYAVLDPDNYLSYLDGTIEPAPAEESPTPDATPETTPPAAVSPSPSADSSSNDVAESTVFSLRWIIIAGVGILVLGGAAFAIFRKK